jgi:ATP-dependent 26S proteasome regulatory subunit
VTRLPISEVTYTALWTERLEVKELGKKYEKTEEDLKAVQSVGQIVAEVLKQLDDERCEFRFPLHFYSFLHEYHTADCSASSI